jgi:hypothetical protein
MTADYSRVAVYDVIEAMWYELTSHGIFKEGEYLPDGFNLPLVPIIPAQQVPEFNNLLPGKPYIMYDIAQKNYGTQWWISEETLILEIISRNSAQVQTMSNFLVDLFRRYEFSAMDIQMQSKPNSPFKFLSFHVDNVDPVQAFSDEGGYMSGNTSITYTYTREVDVSGDGRYL